MWWFQLAPGRRVPWVPESRGIIKLEVLLAVLGGGFRGRFGGAFWRGVFGVSFDGGGRVYSGRSEERRFWAELADIGRSIPDGGQSGVGRTRGLTRSVQFKCFLESSLEILTRELARGCTGVERRAFEKRLAAFSCSWVHQLNTKSCITSSQPCEFRKNGVCDSDVDARAALQCGREF